jgi:hypothetical protein
MLGVTELETRLLASNRDVYDFYDRTDESATLRLSLALPALVLSLATAG